MSKTVKDWTTKSGLRAVILFVNDSHHCGYVGIPADHPLHGVDYDETVQGLSLPDDEPVGKRGVIPLLCSKGIESMSPDCYFNVHGGITFADGRGDYPAKSAGLWWFGFDCAHLGDATKHSLFEGDVFRDEAYVEAECEALAEQLAALTRAQEHSA